MVIHEAETEIIKKNEAGVRLYGECLETSIASAKNFNEMQKYQIIVSAETVINKLYESAT